MAGYDYATVNDLLVTPPFELTKGYYKVKVSVMGANSKYPVGVGYAVESETIAPKNFQTVMANGYSFSSSREAVVKVDETGRGVFVIRANDVIGESYRDLGIEKIEIQRQAILPSVATDVTVTADPDLALKATVAWTNPSTTNVEGETPVITKAIVYRDGAEIATITANIDALKADLKEKKVSLKKAEKELTSLEAKKAKADAKATEEAKKAGSEEKVNIPQALKSLIKNKYWMILLAIFFLNSVVNAFIGVNVYYAQYIMNDDSLVGNLSIFQNIASFAAFAVCTGIIRKIGKQKIAISGVAISFIGYAMVLLNPTSYAVLYIAAIIKGVGNAALSGVMYGMLADTVEYNDWKSGIRAEGLVFSANSIGQKIGSGIGSAVLGWVLAAFGFVSSSAAQPASAISGIRVIFLYVPLVVFAIMFIILLFYKLDKE